MGGSRGGGGLDPTENHKKRFLSNTDQDPLKITKLPSQHSMLGCYRPTSETPFEWHFAGGPMIPLINLKLEDLKVLKRSPDLLNNVKIGHYQLRLIIQTYFGLPYMGMVAILVKYHIYIY